MRYLLSFSLLAQGAFALFSDINFNSYTFGANGFKTVGVASNDLHGFALASAGDFNSDGINDMLIFDFGETLARATSGRTTVLFGQSGSSTTTLDMSTFVTGNSTGFRIYGAAANDKAGLGVNAAGDINNDGIDDILVGSYATVGSWASAGTIYVLFGHTVAMRGFADIDLLYFTSGTYGFKILGPAASANCLYANGAGDVNGDGYQDILVGCDGIVSVYTLFGHATPYTDISLSSFSASASTGFKFTGKTGDGTSWAISGGDFNHDGYADVLVGSPYNDETSRTDCGAVYLVFGHSTGTSFSNIDASTYTFGTGAMKIIGSAANEWSGYFADFAGDINGDGYDDIAVGAVFGDPFGRTDAGITFVVFGFYSATAYPTIDLASLASPAGFKMFGATAGVTFGRSATGAGDINGDGIDDLLIGALYANSNAGMAYVFYGHSTATSFPNVDMASFTSGATGFRMFGAAAGDRLGVSVNGVGDVNGDGTDDILLGAYTADSNSRTDNGAAYVIYGVGPPTSAPTRTPTRVPTALPSSQPSRQPSRQPSAQPSAQPSSHPSAQPSTRPSTQPTTRPSCQPSAQPSARPSAGPTTQPSSQPSTLPTTHPSSLPSAQPSASPSSTPTSQPSVASMERRSRTYKVTNGYAFAVTSGAGSVHTWGEAPRGGDSSVVQHDLQGDVTTVIASRDAFISIKTDGRLVVWGNQQSVSHPAGGFGGAYSVRNLVANEVAFAGTDARTGRVLAFGSPRHGGDVQNDAHCSGCAQKLSANVVKIIASAGAFAARKSDGSVYCWGNKFAGADVSVAFLANITGAMLVRATRSAFAVLLRSGRVLAWGDKHAGGDASSVSDQLMSNVTHIVGSRSVFVAFKANTSIVVWGNKRWGGDTSAVAAELSADVIFVAHTFTAMAALKADGSVVSWGAANGGGDSSAVQTQLHNVEWIYGNSKAFAALTSAGKVVAWGKAAYGGQIPSNKIIALSSGVVSVYYTNRAFAALKDDGSVVVWGQAGHGGSPGAAVEAHLVSGVHTICANDVAFSVIKTDGKVVGWGHPVSIPTAGVLFTSCNLTERAVCA